MTSVPSTTVSAATLQTAAHSWMGVLSVKDMSFMVHLQEEFIEEFALILKEIRL